MIAPAHPHPARPEAAREAKDPSAKAYDSAEEEYHDESRAARTAWGAVKHTHEKAGDNYKVQGVVRAVRLSIEERRPALLGRVADEKMSLTALLDY